MSEKISVYIVSMGATPQAERDFAGQFSARFHIPVEKVLALGGRLPAKIGSYDLEKAREIGMEIKRMGGEVSLRRTVSPPAAPAPAPPAAKEAGSWVVHGHSESQEDMSQVTHSGATDTAVSSIYDSDDDWAPPPIERPPERKIAGKFEAKHIYTAKDGGMDEGAFKKVQELYADRKAKKAVMKSPVVKIGILLLLVSGIALLYVNRQAVIDNVMGLRNTPLTPTYEDRIPAGVLPPSDLTGKYTGDSQYKTSEGEIAFIGINLFVEGKSVHDVVVHISSTDPVIGPYGLHIEYAPGYIKYTKTAGEKVLYTVENTFSTTETAIAGIDAAGRFSFILDAADTGVNPATIPESEKDSLGNTVFLRIEGAYAGEGVFYGGLLTSSTLPMGWEAVKQ